jgi:hypothetical protein
VGDHVLPVREHHRARRTGARVRPPPCADDGHGDGGVQRPLRQPTRTCTHTHAPSPSSSHSLSLSLSLSPPPSPAASPCPAAARTDGHGVAALGARGGAGGEGVGARGGVAAAARHRGLPGRFHPQYLVERTGVTSVNLSPNGPPRRWKRLAHVAPAGGVGVAAPHHAVRRRRLVGLPPSDGRVHRRRLVALPATDGPLCVVGGGTRHPGQSGHPRTHSQRRRGV